MTILSWQLHLVELPLVVRWVCWNRQNHVTAARRCHS